MVAKVTHIRRNKIMDHYLKLQWMIAIKYLVLIIRDLPYDFNIVSKLIFFM